MDGMYRNVAFCRRLGVNLISRTVCFHVVKHKIGPMTEHTFQVFAFTFFLQTRIFGLLDVKAEHRSLLDRIAVAKR